MGTDTRARMVETVARLVMQQGFHGTSLSEILDQSGAPRGSLYFHFPGGKDELILEGTRHAIDQASRAMREAFEQTEDAAAGVAAFFDFLIENQIATDYRFGCPVNALTSDAMTHSTALADICRQGIEEWGSIYSKALERDGLAPDRATQLGEFILAAEEGAILMSRAQRDVGPLERVRDHLATLLRQELAASR